MDEFEVRAGDELTFSTTWVPSHHELPLPLEFERRIEETLTISQGWADECTYDGPYRAAVVRSLLTLRLLTHGGTGGIVAAVTTSLPEELGGERNWDYRFCWLRDASLTLEALLESGYADEARLWRNWLLRAAAGRPAGPADHVRRRRRPCTCSSGRSTTCPGTPGRPPSASATARSFSARPTCSAR